MFAKLDFRITSTDRRIRTRRCAGLTFVELMVTLGLVSLFTTAIVGLSVSTSRSLAEISNYVDLDHFNRVALDHLNRDIRQVNYLTAFETNRLTFMDNDGQPVVFEYLPADRMLARKKTNVTTLLLRECDALQFSIYERAPLANTYNLVPATEVTNCKVVGVNWRCSRSVLGVKANTENAQAAKIVIRNKQN